MTEAILGQEVPMPGEPHCLGCGSLVDGATPMDTQGGPQLGDVSVCVYCGQISIYDGEPLAPRLPTEDELAQVMELEHVMKAVTVASLYRSRIRDRRGLL